MLYVDVKIGLGGEVIHASNIDNYTDTLLFCS